MVSMDLGTDILSRDLTFSQQKFEKVKSVARLENSGSMSDSACVSAIQRAFNHCL
jgi:hypothetical protein